MSEELELGGNITLAGFKDVSHGEVVVVKKMVGSYARKFSDEMTGFESLKVTLKHVHKVEDSEKFELHASIRFNGDHFEVKDVDKNLFILLDSLLQKIEVHAMRESEKMKDK